MTGIDNMVIDISFAERIINKYKKFGRYRLNAPSLILFDGNRPFFPYRISEKNYMFRLFFPLQKPESPSGSFLNAAYQALFGRTVLKQLRKEITQISVKHLQTETEKVLKERVTRETDRAVRRNLTNEIIGHLFHTGIIRRIGAYLWTAQTQPGSDIPTQKQKKEPFLPRSAWQTREKEFDLYYNIASIFENRERQPDTAKKAERKLIQILSDDFYKRTPRSPEEHTETHAEQSRILKRQFLQEEELIRTKQLVNTLDERLTIQEKVLNEFRQNRLTLNLPPDTINGITKEVVRKMEWELHLAKIRRGF